MKILIKTLKGKSINVEVEDSFSTIDFKIHGEPTRQLVLDFNSGSSKVAVMTIFVSTLGGKKVDLQVKESDTIRDVKAKYAEKDSVPVEQQRMLFQGKWLDDSRTIASYNIKNESTFVMMQRLCGC